jgi:hypothetical protein
MPPASGRYIVSMKKNIVPPRRSRFSILDPVGFF